MRNGHTRLWKWNHVTGLWDYGRTCDDATAAEWLARWRAMDPAGIYQASKNKPKQPLLSRLSRR